MVEFDRSRDVMIRFGEFLRRSRNAKGMSQTAVARALGLEVRSGARVIADYENGRRYPNLTRVIELSLVLELQLDRWIHGSPFLNDVGE